MAFTTNLSILNHQDIQKRNLKKSNSTPTMIKGSKILKGKLISNRKDAILQINHKVNHLMTTFLVNKFRILLIKRHIRGRELSQVLCSA